MAFENTFQWSHTRARTFQQCKRLYYYSYYGYWGGWDSGAPAESRLLYTLKRMVTIPMWIGSIVHQCIEYAVKSAKAGTIVRLDELQTMALHLASSGWLDSRNGAWKSDPKKAVNLAEHYYRRLVDPETLDAGFGAMMNSLEAFHRSEVFHAVCAEPASVLAVEEMMTFAVGAVPVVMVADLALKRGDECHIYDWKTGAVTPMVADQLAVYALGAVSKWRFAGEKVRVFAAYLAENTVQEVLCTPADLLKMRETIAAMAAEMSSYCERNNTPRTKRDFPLCREVSVCSACSFRQVCLAELVAEEDKALFLSLQKLKNVSITTGDLFA